jgi:hypothetical protein
MVEFHLCPDKACCAFVADFSDHVLSPFCGALRFTKCIHKGCRFKNYEE